MVGDRKDASTLPDDIPNLKSHTIKFYTKLFGTWAAMGFRNPQISIERKINA